MRERGDASPVNQCAPFCLWATPEGMISFLWGPGFQGIVNDFGRPVVQHWTGLSYEEGPASGSAPGTATRRRTPLGEGAPPATRWRTPWPGTRARHVGTGGGLRSGGRSAPLGTAHVTLWADAEAPADEGERFRVLHLSAPGPGRLGAGRHW